MICGYPPEDLVLKPALQQHCRAAIESLAADTADGGPASLVGAPWVEKGALYPDVGDLRAVTRRIALEICGDEAALDSATWQPAYRQLIPDD